MGYLYEELIRRFSELSNETAGEHFTPREVICFIMNLLSLKSTLFPYTTLFRSKHSVPRFFVPEHGTMFTLALVRNKEKIGRAAQQECRDRPRMPSPAGKKQRSIHLVGRRPAAGRLQAERVRQGDFAAGRAPPPG